MKFEFFIAKRYLLKGRKNSFISIISLVSIIGIMIGVAALIVAMSLINGFQNDIKKKLLNSTSHILLDSLNPDGFSGYEKTIDTILRTFPQRVQSAQSVIYGTVLAKGNTRDSSGAVFKGLNFNKDRTEDWLLKLNKRDLPRNKNEIIIGKDLARKLMLNKGDTCLLIIPRGTLSPTGLMARFKRFKITGIFNSGLYEIDNTTIITNLRTAQTVFGLKNKINYIQIYLHDPMEAEEIADEMAHILPAQLTPITWKDLNAALYTALKLEKTVLFFTLTLIIIVASLNIIAGLILLVIQKIKDIGILISTGATAKTIRRIFFFQGGIIGIIGTFAGTLLGLFICYLANRFELISIPAEIYQMSYVPFKTSPFELFLIISVSIGICFLATLIPSKKAASVNVIEAVKSE
jgi:lipoprotein-releasing system permease protein